MKRKVEELRVQYADKNKAIETKLAELEAYTLKREKNETVTDAETLSFNDGMEEVKRMKAEAVAIYAEIKTEENIELQRSYRAVGAPANKGFSEKDEKDLASFSFRKAVLLSNDELKRSAKSEDFGFELEMSQEFEVERNNVGLPKGDKAGAGVPEKVLIAMSQMELRRDMAVNTPSDGTKGGLTVDRDLDTNIIRLFTNMNNWRSLGATVKTGLKNNYEVLTEATLATAQWEGETDENALTDISFGKKNMSPKRLSASTIYSRQLAIQSSLSVEAEMRRALFTAVDDKLMDTAINGTGANDIPLGFLAAGITLLTTTSNANDGAALDYEKVVAMETKLDVDNALNSNMAFLGNSKVRGQLKVSKMDAGSGLYVMPNSNELIGYNYINTNFVPSNIAKGTSGSILSALILGYFPDFMISQWGGFSIVTDPYTKARTSQIVITIDSFWDMLVRRTKSFVAYKDIKA